ncbi:ABC transporter ATP-binding protein [Brevibacterium atlanticum]|uniref:ABC transporter ATP-binding protein n=1 Tax=Brevibacterium atlanticum TaxID=2697563 RepID=UPI00141DBEF4|nr:ABC transporter ATP-binding protein [Brevibacterium atlanticum]
MSGSDGAPVADRLPVTDGLPVADGRTTWRTVIALSRGRRLTLLAVALLGTVSAAAGLVPPAVIGSLVDRVQDGSADLSSVAWALAIMVLAAFLGALGAAITVVLAARAYHAMLAELRENLVQQALALPQGMVERAGTGDLISRSSDDVSQIADAAPQIIPAFTTVVFTIIVTFAGMTALDPWYGLTVVAVVPVYLCTMRWYLRTGPRVYRAERTAMSGRAQQINESQRGHSTVVGLRLGESRHASVLGASWAVVEHSLRARTVQNMFFGRLNIAEFLGLAAILVIGFLLNRAGLSSVGAATAAMLLFLRLLGPINQLLLVIDTLQSVFASLARMVGVITAEPAGGHVHRSQSAEVRLGGVSFSYDGAEAVIKDLDLQIGAGERVAIVGSSGAGKTTVAALIAGIHEPGSGTVRAPANTALVTQEGHIFAGTLRQNLTLAAPTATDAQIRAALGAVGAGGLLELLPDGLGSAVGQAGRELTFAQAQQVALARVILIDPDLVILDEATAEAGSAQAETLDRAAAAALDGRTGLVIAHRLSQAASCDRIIVLEHGQVVESGRHEDLAIAGGVYERLWNAWSLGLTPDRS